MTHHNKPIHQLRAPEQQTPKKAKSGASAGWPPGYFTSLILEHRWPPMWEPKFRPTKWLQWSEISRKNREARMEKGDFGTIRDLSPKATAHPVNQSLAAQARAAKS
jgi:hypothetical protein